MDLCLEEKLEPNSTFQRNRLPKRFPPSTTGVFRVGSPPRPWVLSTSVGTLSLQFSLAHLSLSPSPLLLMLLSILNSKGNSLPYIYVCNSLTLPFIRVPEDPSVVREVLTSFQFGCSVAFYRTGHPSFVQLPFHGFRSARISCVFFYLSDNSRIA